ncbi:hypothetical protein J6590_104827 [Homalodisca vitripennis]|nr:hypothetical protein J6590_104827 [Homalodisca vitripennis]
MLSVQKVRLLRSDSIRTHCVASQQPSQAHTDTRPPRVSSAVGTHITAPRPTRESADCWPSHGETIAAQYLTCKFRHVRTDTRPSWPHRGRTVTDSSGLNFDGPGAV